MKLSNHVSFFKGATKLYFTHYSCVAIVFLVRVYLSLHPLDFILGKKFFCISVFDMFSVCPEF